MTSAYLLVRSRDLVVLAVRWDGCEVHPGTPVPTLVATAQAASVTLTFPPQAILEQATDLTGFFTPGKVHSDSRLAGVSELAFRIAPGNAVELTVAGLLAALADVTEQSVVELPWGLKLRPHPQAGPGMVSEHPAEPVAGPGPDTVGLWQARLRALQGSRTDARLKVTPLEFTQSSGMPARPLFQTVPLDGQRSFITMQSAESLPRVSRLELSALGGSLTAEATWTAGSWSHDMVLGRDHRVEVTNQGRFWPFGHRAVFQVFTNRAFLPVVSPTRHGTAAALQARHVLVILEPLRTGLRTRTFPFDEVEILGQSFLIDSVPPQDLSLPFIPRRGGAPLRIPVRCRSGGKDLHFSIPMIFVGLPSTEPGAAALSAWRPLATVGMAGVELDMLGAGGLPGDIHEVHSLTLDGKAQGAGFRPDLEKFAVVLPALRSLLPGAGHEAARTVTYAPELRAGQAVPKVPLRFDAPVLVNFTGNTDRSGALVAPRFDADGISRDLGPVASSVLPDQPNLGTALGEAFRGATLFGFPLASLIDTGTNPKPAPPTILQRRVGQAVSVQMRWADLKLVPHGPFRPKPGGPPPQLDLVVGAGPVPPGAPEPPNTCTLSNFTLALPPSSPLITLTFDRVRFTQRPGEPMKLELTGFGIEFGGELKLLQELQKRVMSVLGGHGPTVSVSSSEIVVGYQLRLPDAPAGMFVMRNIAVLAAVHVPFAQNPVRVVVGFASREQPFALTVSGFGGGGYVAVEIVGDTPSKLELSMEFGAMIALDFVVAQAEVHALGGVRFVHRADGSTALEAFIRIGGSVRLLGLVTVSVDLRVNLTFSDPPPRLTGRASLVIELDLTLYSETVTVDSGQFELIGGAAPAAPPDEALPAEDDAARQKAWENYWEAFA
ncbi:hypothetical protein ACFQY4_20015 [Catellatospora bangladeshensis]|uniref:Uncharacterized protein n=1 Tax=Catellatospora bangladeshensis TaxID=310355 RepID=A0A8J3NM96_9ACTN|nr:hypothetical protein [Catellatospora bangladeshensis]GIF85917.1 hypothetical protein Cba03nite_72660 [Catellatospora bangladeshensis]